MQLLTTFGHNCARILHPDRERCEPLMNATYTKLAGSPGLRQTDEGTLLPHRATNCSTALEEPTLFTSPDAC
jgi:hypothetical protein